MKKFIKQSLLLLLSLIMMSIILDKVYTYVHYNSAPRNMPDYIMSLKKSDSFDFAVFGSSRALHNIDINLIEESTGKKGFNFGVSGSSVFEIKLSVQQIIKRKITKNIFIQIDYIWNESGSGGECTVDWLTYINETDIWNEFKKIDTNNKYLLYKKMPYLRYCEYGSRLGFRELMMSVFNRDFSRLESKGFSPLSGKVKNAKKTVSYTLKNDYNIHIKEIIALCKRENVNLFFFTSPILNFKGDHKILEKNLPNYYDFSTSITDTKYFQDNTHINHDGSKLLTKKFINQYLRD